MSQARTSDVGGNIVLLKGSENAAKKTEDKFDASSGEAWVISKDIVDVYCGIEWDGIEVVDGVDCACSRVRVKVGGCGWKSREALDTGL